jgi:hypothetical protein
MDIADRICERSGVSVRPCADDGPASRRGRLSGFLYRLVQDERAVAHTTDAIDAHADGTAEQLPQLSVTVAMTKEETDGLEGAVRGGRQRDVSRATAEGRYCPTHEES